VKATKSESQLLADTKKTDFSFYAIASCDAKGRRGRKNTLWFSATTASGARRENKEN
jgi:hypothetical protein